jgi:small subunit ribosomal protein S4
MRYTGPKARKARRQGANIFGSAKYDKILTRKPNAPGMQAAERGGRPGKLSEYGKQLLEKQKVCSMYGLTDKQLRSLYLEASGLPGQTNQLIHSLIERRLDNALYRAGFAMTRMQARQFISHGLFAVNGTRVTIASYRMKVGDKVQVRDAAKNSPVFGPIVTAQDKYTAPSWLQADPSTLSFTVASLPAEEAHFDQLIDMRKVIGFYSR